MQASAKVMGTGGNMSNAKYQVTYHPVYGIYLRDIEVFTLDCSMFLPLMRYVVCLKSKCTDFLFKCLLDSHEITSCLLQSMTLGKLHIGSNVFSTDHGSTRSHFL